MLDGIVSGDSGSVSPDTVTAEYTSKNAGTTTINITGVTLSGTALVLGADYTFTSCTNNTNAGTATLTINGKDNYTGEASQTFTIAKADPTVTWPTGLTTNG